MAGSRDPTALPEDLPAPVDDGRADHLPGTTVPPVALPSTDGGRLDLHAASAGRRLIIYCYPRTGQPGAEPLVPEWDQIPGARGCTPESCGFRDHHAELAALGAGVVGLSTQDTEYQREAVQRLQLPFPLLSDADLELTSALRLPVLAVGGHTLLARLTMVIKDATIEHVFYPVFPPGTHATEVLHWLESG